MNLFGWSNTNQQDVDDKGRAKVFAETVSDLEGISIDGKLWNVDFTMAPAGAATVLYIKNTSSAEIHIPDIEIVGTANGWVKLFKVTSTAAPTGTLVTINGRCRNVGIDVYASSVATIYSSAAVGALTLDSEPFLTMQLGANVPRILNIDSHTQIPAGKIIAMTCSGAMTLTGSLTLYEEE